MRAQLLPLEGGTPIDLAKELTLIGRKEDCDIRLDHKSVSKMHCVIVKTDGLLLLRDLGSTNGTRVNGQRIRRAALLPNDQLGIATYKFKVHLGPEPAPAVASNEHTQALDAHEVEEMFRKALGKDPEDSDPLPLQQPLQRNQLPDVYPDDKE